MRVKKAEFLRFASGPGNFPPENYPEVALVGRSNVGKSSLINILVKRKNLARTSNTPGKTRAVHFYLINGFFYLVDLPGYGYAKVSRQMRQGWAALLEEYFSCRGTLKMIIQVVDLRHEPSGDDRQMSEWIRYFTFPALIVATKADKVPRGKRGEQKKLIASFLNVEPREIVLFSAVTKEGRHEVLSALNQALGDG